MDEQTVKRKIIWHYTDFKALDGILVKGELRLCNTKGMNDKKEILGFVMGIEDALAHKFPDDAEQIHRIFREQIKKRENENIYGSSFSLLRNDAAQWERYGYGGQGVSIGFDRDLLKTISEPYLLEEVSYEKDYRNYDFMGLTNQSEEEIGKEILNGDTENFFGKLWACSGAYKDYSFKSEQEIRLITPPIAPDSLNPQNKIYGDFYYDVMSEKIREYLVFPLYHRCGQFGIDFEELVTDIIIGPKSPQSKVILQNYLRVNGRKRLADAVRVSDCPLR